MISVIVDLWDRHLHSQDGEDVDDDEEDEGEVSQGAQGGDDDTQQNLKHWWSWLLCGFIRILMALMQALQNVIFPGMKIKSKILFFSRDK